MHEPCLKSIHKTNPYTQHKTKQTYTNIQHKFSKSPFSITPAKRAHKARTCWYWSYLINTRLKKNIKREWTIKIKNSLKIKKMHHGKYQCHMAASCTYHLSSSPSCSTRAIRKSPTLKRKTFQNFLVKRLENGPLLAQVEKWQDGKSTSTRQKNRRRQERGIKGQPWDSRQGKIHPTSPQSPFSTMGLAVVVRAGTAPKRLPTLHYTEG